MRFKVTLALRKEIEVCAPTAAAAVKHVQEKVLTAAPEGHIKLLSVELLPELNNVVSIVDDAA